MNDKYYSRLRIPHMNTSSKIAHFNHSIHSHIIITVLTLLRSISTFFQVIINTVEVIATASWLPAALLSDRDRGIWRQMYSLVIGSGKCSFNLSEHTKTNKL